jgi:hypothetical protein
MANATSLANRIEAIFDEEEPEQSWMDNRVRNLNEKNTLLINISSVTDTLEDE